MLKSLVVPCRLVATNSVPSLQRKLLRNPIAIVGYGNIGRGVLPILERHFSFDQSLLHVIEPKASRQCTLLPFQGYSNIHADGLTEQNYATILDGIFVSPSSAAPLPTQGDGADGSVRGVIVNCSVDTCSVDLAKYAQSRNLIYLDTVVEPWKGYYWDKSMPSEQRTNYALRERLLALKRAAGGKGSTCVSCVGANPGMVSWILKDALMQLAKDTMSQTVAVPTTQLEWAELMQRLGVKGVHIAERDTQFPIQRRPPDAFWNTWSVEGFLSEGFQPAELGWGTHEKWIPENARRHLSGCRAAIYLDQPGANTRVRTWCPSLGPQFGYLVTHNESISTADYYTVPAAAARGDGSSSETQTGDPSFRPTVHYAYHPCESALASFHECFGRGNVILPQQKVLLENDIGGGFDELGVLLFGHSRNALWMGSTLSHEACVALVPSQNATALQVTSAMTAALTWALENPRRGIVEAEDLDHEFCLSIQKPYLGKYWHEYTSWTPLDAIIPSEKNQSLFPMPSRVDTTDPWQFSNVLV